MGDTSVLASMIIPETDASPLAHRYYRHSAIMHAWFSDDTKSLETYYAQYKPDTDGKEQGMSLLEYASLAVLLGHKNEALDLFRKGFEEKEVAFRYVVASAPDWPPRLFVLSDPQARKILEDNGFDLAWFDEPEVAR